MPVSSCINLTLAQQNELITLVQQTIDMAVGEDRLILPPAPQSKILLLPAACFVTLYVKQRLRGCIGTYLSDKPLWHNVCEYSYRSACCDRRFTPLEKKDINNVSFEISILSALEPLINKGEQALLGELQVDIDGLLLKDKQHSAIFLPSVWQSLTTPVLFLQALKEKGCWTSHYWSQEIDIFRFEAFIIRGALTESKCRYNLLN